MLGRSLGVENRINRLDHLNTRGRAQVIGEDDQDVIRQACRGGDEQALASAGDRGESQGLAWCVIRVVKENVRRNAERRHIAAVQDSGEINGQPAQPLVSERRQQLRRDVAQHLTKADSIAQGTVERRPGRPRREQIRGAMVAGRE